MNSVSLSIGFVTWRTPELLLAEFLESLVKAIEALAERLPVQVSVCAISNDAPKNASFIRHLMQRQATKDSQVHWRCIDGHGNIGYGAAQNLAIRSTRSDYHLILNPDLVLDREALLNGVQFLQTHPDAVMATPQGYDAAGQYAKLAKRGPTVLVLLLRALSMQPSNGFFGRRLGTYIYSDRLPSAQAEPVEFASGCFMLCRTSVLQAVGGFDEGYFLYFEDFDLCRRIAPCGRICELPTVRIRHYGGQTAKRGLGRIPLFVRSGCRFFSRYGWRLA